MPVTKNAAFRYRIIDSCLRNPRKRYPTINALQEQISEALDLDSVISESSIHKDFKSMRDFYKAPITYHPVHKGYYYEDEHFSINAFPLTSEEIQVLDLSSSFLRQIKYSGFFQQFETAIDKLISGFRLSRIPGHEQSRFMATEEPITDIGTKWLEIIYEAILHKQVLKIIYKRFNSPETKEHHMSPYVLKEYRNRWYAVGYSDLGDAVITLALDRIHSVEVMPKEKYYKTDFDEDEYFKYSFGVTVYANALPEKVRLLFTPQVAGYILTKPLHHTQEILKESSEGTTIEITCHLTPELEMTILSYGETIRVLNPDKLIDKLKNRISAMSHVYM
jgi:predicted DNA-binding transcriptional regulator YafY